MDIEENISFYSNKAKQFLEGFPEKFLHAPYSYTIDVGKHMHLLINLYSKHSFMCRKARWPGNLEPMH